MKIENQNLIQGSSYLRGEKYKFDRVKFMIDNMDENLAFIEYLNLNKTFSKVEKIKALDNFKKRFQVYRTNWKLNPTNAYKDDNFKNYLPLCLDIETASICDLACPHCFREYIITPDKIMNFELYKKIIDTAVKWKVPSIKLNWRGEPLLNPKLPKFINYAKTKGILEVSINTNATNLDKKRSNELIDSGLDLIIYSFDGGTKKTYEKMRPSRFKSNKFEDVLKNIRQFSEIRKQRMKKFPITKIQMVLTNESRKEINDFYDLFSTCVDDVTVTQYTERGGNLESISKDKKDKLINYLNENNLDKNTNFYVGADEEVYISIERKPCDQLFQRLMITFDGRVAMCCHDWGAQHCLGFIDKRAFEIDKTVKELERNIKDKKKGFELLINAKKPKKFNEPNKEICSLESIWNGNELNKVRKLHQSKKLDQIEICKNCDFKDTYEWKKIGE